MPSYSSGVVSGVYHPSSHPLHSSAGHHGTAKRPNSASQSGSSNSHSFRLKSDLGTRCSWKFVAIFFMLFSFLLVSALIYTAGKGSLALLSSIVVFSHLEGARTKIPIVVFLLPRHYIQSSEISFSQLSKYYCWKKREKM